MATIPKGFSFVTWTGPLTPLKTAPWVGNVRSVHDTNSLRTGFVGWTSSNLFPAFLNLVPTVAPAPPKVYLFNSAVQFVLEDASVGGVVAITLPGPPTGVTATAPAGTGTVSINATPPTNTGGSFITGYQVFRNGSPTALPGATNVILPYTDTTAVVGTAYTYQLMAHNVAGYSTLSIASTPGITPSAPSYSPTYHGAVNSPVPSATSVQGLTGEQWAPATPRTVSASCTGTYPCFAEPDSYGPRVITDANGYNIMGDIAITTANIAAVNYTVYTHQNPQYDPSFIFNL